MAAVMPNTHRDKVRLPSIASITGSGNNRLPPLASITGTSQPLPLAHTQQDPLSTLRAAADIFYNEDRLPETQLPSRSKPHPQSQPQPRPQQQALPQPQTRTTPPPPMVPSTGIETPVVTSGPRTSSPSGSPNHMFTTPTIPHEATFQPHPVYHPGPATFQQQQTPPYAPVYYNSYTAVPQQQFEVFSQQDLARSHAHQRHRQSLSRTITLRAQQACQRCGITETPEWRKGPNGARTLCNACGLFHAKVLKRDGPEAAAYAIMNSTVTKRKHMTYQRRITHVSPGNPPAMPMIPVQHGAPIIPHHPQLHPQHPQHPQHPYHFQQAPLPQGQIPQSHPVQFIPGPSDPPPPQGHPMGYSPLPPPNMERK